MSSITKDDLEFLSDLQGLLYKYRVTINYSVDLGIYFCFDDSRLIESSEDSLDARDIYKLKEKNQ